MRKVYGLGLTYIALSLALVGRAERAEYEPVTSYSFVHTETSVAEWFRVTRPHCNALEVRGHLDRNPPPDLRTGIAFKAACLALAGRIDLARAEIESLPHDTRWRAAGVLFDIAHPAADAGDELAAGPIMELVVEFWPNHYRALYHAGASRFEQGDHPKSTEYLERFLVEYPQVDFWTADATTMLERMGAR